MNKNPLLAAFLSALIPGLGQGYVGKAGRGIIIFILCLVFLPTGILALLIYAFGVLDAFYQANKLNQGVK